ncbi:hypothetical protein L1987_62334 [Smallanthus sonchifolius]|uniref:Uncharacterized protein n=1 Tax=Smallanthus sonchifolius TaxID=185202 RepID=A0ACB9CA59_9ASTR|nr:hypothetical protein L1987_62334 [Smallanthus sonchifolius]
MDFNYLEIEIIYFNTQQNKYQAYIVTSNSVLMGWFRPTRSPPPTPSALFFYSNQRRSNFAISSIIVDLSHLLNSHPISSPPAVGSPASAPLPLANSQHRNFAINFVDLFPSLAL